MECFLLGIRPAIIPTCSLRAEAMLWPVGSAMEIADAFLLDVLLPKKLLNLLRKPWFSSRLLRQRLYRSMLGWDFLFSLGCELKLTEFLPRQASAEGQLARGMTGGRTDRRSMGRPPLMLGVRLSLFLSGLPSSSTVLSSV